MSSTQSKQLSYDNCLMIAVTTFPNSWDSFFIIIVTAFPDNWDSLFKTAMTANSAAWALLIFPHLDKTKTNYWNYLSLAKIPSSYVTLSPAALIQNSKNTLKLNIPFLAKILRWILWRFITVLDRFWLIFFTKIPI